MGHKHDDDPRQVGVCGGEVRGGRGRSGGVKWGEKEMEKERRRKRDREQTRREKKEHDFFLSKFEGYKQR